MDEPINANAQYIKILINNGKFILIDMNDIAKIGLGDKVHIDGFTNDYTVILIDWKVPYSNQWQAFIDDDGLKLWQDFCSKPSKDVDK